MRLITLNAVTISIKGKQLERVLSYSPNLGIRLPFEYRIHVKELGAILLGHRIKNIRI